MPLTGEKKKAYQKELMQKRRSNAGSNKTEGSNKGLTEANKDLQRRIIDLEAEVTHLKQLLAQRPTGTSPIHTPMPPRFATTFSKERQASPKGFNG